MPDENKTQEQILKEQIDAAIAAVQKQPAGQPIELHLETGETVKAATPDEAISTLKKMKEDTTKALRDREQQIRDLQAKLAAQQLPASGQPRQFSREEYWRLWEQDPLQAQNYLDSFRLGIEQPERVPEVFQQTWENAESFRDLYEISQFLTRNPDFPGGEQNADLLLGELASTGRSWTADDLDVLYHRMVREGKITPAKKEEPLVPAGATPPPQLTGQGGRSANPLDNVDKLSDAELEKILRDSGMLR